MTPLSKTLGRLLLFAVICPWYSCGFSPNHDNHESSGEEPLFDPVPDPSGSHCQRNKNPKGLGFIGVKYNLLRGNPEGKTEIGGVDPGLEITRKILKLTNDDGEAVPDQICYEPRQVCSVSKSAKIFGGTKRYQEKLNVDVTAKGKSAILAPLMNRFSNCYHCQFLVYIVDHIYSPRSRKQKSLNCLCGISIKIN